MTKEELPDLSLERCRPKDDFDAASSGPSTLSQIARLAIGQSEQFESSALDDFRHSLFSQLPESALVYQKNADSLNRGRSRDQWISIEREARLKNELFDWLNNKSLSSYVTTVLNNNPETRFTLITKPQIGVSAKEILNIAEIDPKIKNWSELLAFYDSYDSAYLAVDESGQSSFSLIPDRPTENLYGKVARQRSVLRKLQLESPFLRVPSLLEAVSYHQLLKTKDTNLAQTNFFGKSYTIHFDLPEKQFRGVNCVPMSFMSSSGLSLMIMHQSDIPFNTRLAIG